MYRPNAECPDRKRSGSPGEYRVGVDRCPRCGSRLVYHDPSFPERATSGEGPHAQASDFVSLGPLHDAALLPIVKCELERAGIRYRVRDEEQRELMPWGSVASASPFLSPPEIEVAADRASEAGDLLAAIGGSEPLDPAMETDDERPPSGISLMKIREKHEERVARSTLGRLFRGRPSLVKASLLGVGAAAFAAWAIAATISAERIASGPLMIALGLGLASFDQVRRWRESRPGLLPARVQCPSCDTRLTLSNTEHRTRAFRCTSCYSTFEVSTEEALHEESTS